MTHLKRISLVLTCLSALACLAQGDEIHTAAAAGDLEQMKALVAGDASLVTAVNERGRTALHEAAYAGQAAVAEFLLEKGAHADQRDARGSTALHLAAAKDSVDTIRVLIEAGLNVDVRNSSQGTPLHSAASRGACEAIELLLDKGADPEAAAEDGSPPLFWAAWSGQTPAVALLLDRGADLHATVEGGWTALHSAARQGHRGAARVLLERGIPVDAAMTNGLTPLAVAAEGAHTRLIAFLLGEGADPNGVPGAQETPMTAAARANSSNPIDQLMEAGAQPSPDFIVNAIWMEQVQLVSRLLDQGLDANSVNRDGLSLLQAAVITRRADLVEILLEHNVNVEYTNHNNETALSIAAGRGAPDILRMLIEAGVDLDMMDQHGATALQTALIRNDLESMNILLENGVDPNQREVATGKTMLHLAALRGNREMAAAMLEKGTKIEARDDLGKTAIQYAARYGHQQIVDLLKTQGAQGKDLEEKSGKDSRLAEPLKEKQTYMWYLGHCGWALKTRNHLLIFDYSETPPLPGTPCLLNGHINPAEIADQKVTVFVTHEHGDHYNRSILGWRRAVKDITYLFGFQPEVLGPDQQFPPDFTDYETMAPRESRNINGMDITTLRANDAGVGFLVEVDGLKIYHAGDHAGWLPDQREGFIREIDFMAEQTDRVDLAFVNATGCHARNPEALKEGNRYTVNQLHPTILVPTHAENREFIYRRFAATAEEEAWGVKVLCADYRGDCFLLEGDEFRLDL